MKENLKIKEQLFLKCSDLVNSRLGTIQRAIAEIQESLLSETKSSAGDKHETGRAMLQLEREKAGNQLAEIQKIKEILSKIDISKSLKTTGLGSVVYTTKANYFIAISAGELEVDTIKFYAISNQTPMAKLLLGKHVNDTFNFRNEVYKIIGLI